MGDDPLAVSFAEEERETAHLPQGWLRKRGGGKHSSAFQRRWCVLTRQGQIEYSKPSFGGGLVKRGAVNVRGGCVEAGQELEFSVLPSGFSSRTYIFQAPSQAEQGVWLAALHKAAADQPAASGAKSDRRSVVPERGSVVPEMRSLSPEDLKSKKRRTTVVRRFNEDSLEGLNLHGVSTRRTSIATGEQSTGRRTRFSIDTPSAKSAKSSKGSGRLNLAPATPAGGILKAPAAAPPPAAG